MTMQLVWKCLACGIIHPVEAPPERCPCGATKADLIRIEED